MATFKHSQQNQGQPLNKKSVLSSPNSVVQGSEATTKPLQHNPIVRDTFGQNLAQRIKKAKDEIFVQNHQRKGKSSEKKNQSVSKMEEEENLNNSKATGQNKRKGTKNQSNIGLVSDQETKINLIQDELLSSKLLGNVSLLNQSKLQEDLEREEEEHSDFNSNQIECSESNRDQEENDDSFMGDLIPQKNQEFGPNSFSILGGGIDTQKFISIIFNKNEGSKDTQKQQSQEKEQKGKKSKEKKESSSSSSGAKQKDIPAKSKKSTAESAQGEAKPKREYKKRAKKSENSDQDAMKNSQTQSSKEDNILAQSLAVGGNQFSLNLQNLSIAQSGTNQNVATPKNNISKNIIIQNYSNNNQQGGQQGNQQNINNENYNNSNNNYASSSAAAAAGGSSSTKKGFRQYNKEIKTPTNQNENSNQPQIMSTNNENQQDQNNTLNATLEALLQGANNQAVSIPSTPSHPATSKRKQKGESKQKKMQEGNQGEGSVSKSKSKMLTTPAKVVNSLYQEPSSVSCRLNMDIENIGIEQFDSNFNTNQALQATATTAPSSSSKKQKINTNTEYKEKSEEKPKKKVKMSQQEEQNDQNFQQTPQSISFTSGKKSKKEKKQKEIIPDQITFKNSQILNVTKTDNSLLVSIAQSSEDPQQQEIERQIEEFSFTKEVKQKLNPQEKKAEEDQLKESKVFHLLWEKQQIYKRKLELYQLSSFERYQQHKMLELRNTFKPSDQFFITNQQILEKSNSSDDKLDKMEEQEDAAMHHLLEEENHQHTKPDVSQQNIFTGCDTFKVNRELSFSGPNVSTSINEEEEILENNQEANKIKSPSVSLEKHNDMQIKQEDENSDSKKSTMKKSEKQEQDTRDYTQKFQDLKNKFVMLKQTFKPSIITA